MLKRLARIYMQKKFKEWTVKVLIIKERHVKDQKKDNQSERQSYECHGRNQLQPKCVILSLKNNIQVITFMITNPPSY